MHFEFWVKISAETRAGESSQCHHDVQHYQRQAEEDRGAASAGGSGETESGTHSQKLGVGDENTDLQDKTGTFCFISLFLTGLLFGVSIIVNCLTPSLKKTMERPKDCWLRNGVHGSCRKICSVIISESKRRWKRRTKET